MKDIVVWRRWGLVVRNVVVWWWRRWVGIKRMLHLIKRRFLSLFLLMKDVDGVLQFYEPCPILVDVLPSGLSTLSRYLSSHDGFLVLMDPLNFFLHPTQLLLCTWT
jgi:hypothetical protein